MSLDPSPHACLSVQHAYPARRQAGCPLCEAHGGGLIWQDDRLRVISIDDADYPGFTRVVWHDHAGEMTDLSLADRDHLMRIVYCVEAMQRAHLAVDKINLAAFGNMVPHLHWHVIPRWTSDRHFPDAYWSPARVPADRIDTASMTLRRERVPAFHAALVDALTRQSA